ncbi:MAG TPA: hypothetical protein VK999_01860, partial [Methylotenera sp.]|nr:hypothetical protein [Methylotenera sp.]
MWFSSKVDRKALAEQLVITHQSIAAVVDSDQNIIAANKAFSQLDPSLNQSDHNNAFAVLLNRLDDLNLSQQIVP